MKVAYIAGPYRNKTINQTFENILAARRVALEWWRKGYAVICPHTNTILMDGGISGDEGFADCDAFLEGDFELLRRSDVVVMMPNWKESEGATKERNFAKKLNKEIFYKETGISIARNHQFKGIGISGKARSGKDTLAQMLSKKLGWPVTHFADEVKLEWWKDFAYEIKSVRAKTRGLSYIHKEVIVEEVNNLKNEYPEIRKQLIDIGMSSREHDPQYWIKKLDCTIPQIIADVRFRNEYDYLKGLGYFMIRMEASPETRKARGDTDIEHISETELDNIDAPEWNWRILNDNGVKLLEEQARFVVANLIQEDVCDT